MQFYWLPVVLSLSVYAAQQIISMSGCAEAGVCVKQTDRTDLD